MKHHHFLPAFIGLIASYIGLHFYCAKWLLRNFQTFAGHSSAVRLSFLLLAFFSPFMMYLKRTHALDRLDWLYSLGHLWMGAILIIASIFFLSDIVSRIATLFRPQLSHIVPMTALALVIPAIAYSLYQGIKAPEIKEMTFFYKDLPEPLENFTIAQISDMHVDSPWKLRQLADSVEKINAAGADLVVLTGDLIDRGLTCPEDLGQVALSIKSPNGVYGVLGNHEYYYGLERSMDCYKSFGIKLLKNDSAYIAAGNMRITGIGDIATEGLSKAEINGTLKKSEKAPFNLVLSHQPLFYDALSAQGADLVLSGHTHRGQIFPFNFLTRLAYRYFYGEYSIGKTRFYVTSGTGTWGPPLRFLTASEIPVIKLRKETK